MNEIKILKVSDDINYEFRVLKFNIRSIVRKIFDNKELDSNFIDNSVVDKYVIRNPVFFDGFKFDFKRPYDSDNKKYRIALYFPEKGYENKFNKVTDDGLTYFEKNNLNNDIEGKYNEYRILFLREREKKVTKFMGVFFCINRYYNKEKNTVIREFEHVDDMIKISRLN